MEMQDRPHTKVVTISDQQSKTFGTGSTKHTFKDQEGMKYNLWQNKKDGNETMAYAVYKLLAPNATVRLKFKQEEKEYNGRPYTERTVMSIDKQISEDEKVAVPPFVTPKEIEKRVEVKEDDKVFGMCKYGFMLEIVKFCRDIDSISVLWDKIEEAGEEGAKRSMRRLLQTQQGAEMANREEEMAGGEPINPEDIPF